MIDALESAIRTGNDLVIGLTVGQVLESMKKIHDRDDYIAPGPDGIRFNPGSLSRADTNLVVGQTITTDGKERMRVNPGVWPQGDTLLKMGDAGSTPAPGASS